MPIHSVLPRAISKSRSLLWRHPGLHKFRERGAAQQKLLGALKLLAKPYKANTCHAITQVASGQERVLDCGGNIRGTTHEGYDVQWKRCRWRLARTGTHRHSFATPVE